MFKLHEKCWKEWLELSLFDQSIESFTHKRGEENKLFSEFKIQNTDNVMIQSLRDEMIFL